MKKWDEERVKVTRGKDKHFWQGIHNIANSVSYLVHKYILNVFRL